MFDGIGGILFGTRPFDIQLRCFSAPFYERADSKKINELNHGGKVYFIIFCIILFDFRFYFSHVLCMYI